MTMSCPITNTTSRCELVWCEGESLKPYLACIKEQDKMVALEFLHKDDIKESLIYPNQWLVMLYIGGKQHQQEGAWTWPLVFSFYLIGGKHYNSSTTLWCP